MSRVIGYARLSRGDEDAVGLDTQADAIRLRYPTAEVVTEIASGGRADNRPVFQAVLEELRRGDTLVVSRLDRLTRSLLDFAKLVEEAQRRGWALVVLDQGFDMGSAAGRAMAGMLVVFAQYERELIALRTREGLRKRGLGIPVEVRGRVLELAAEGLSQRRIAADLDLHKESVARVLRSGARA